MDKTELLKKLEEKEKYLDAVRSEMIVVTGQVALLRELIRGDQPKEAPIKEKKK